MKNSFPEEFIETVRARNDIVSVISEYVPLKKKGKNYWGNCPFHNENTPSFSVTPDKQLFYCFGCGTGGNVFTFLMKHHNATFAEAVEMLAQRTGLALPTRERSPENVLRERQRELLFKVNRAAADFFHRCLAMPGAEEAREYLTRRGITQETVTKFHLGYAPAEWDALVKFFGRKGVSATVLEKAGLAVKRPAGSYYDRFRHRIMFPIFNAQGRVVGFGGRVLDNAQPKYLNSPETLVFNKRHTLYGLHLAASAIRDKGQTIIVEGYMDAITAHQYGLENVVASLGTAFTPEQAKLLLRYSHNVVIAYDTDMAGQAATLRGLELLTGLSARVKVVSLPQGKDPDEFLRQQGREAFISLVDNAQSLVDYQIDRALRQVDASRLEGKLAILNSLLPLLARLDNAVERDAYIAQLAEKLGVSETAVRRELAKISGRHSGTGGDRKAKNGKNITSVSLGEPSLPPAHIKAEQGLIYLTVADSALLAIVRSSLTLEDFTYKSIWEAIFALDDAHHPVTADSVLSRLTEEKDVAAFTRILFAEKEFTDKERIIADYIKQIRDIRIRARLAELDALLKDQLIKHDDTRWRAVLAEYQQLQLLLHSR